MNNQNKEVRYNLRLPSAIYAELGRIAKEQGTSRLELIRKFIKLGLLALQYENDLDAGFYVKRAESDAFERVILL